MDDMVYKFSFLSMAQIYCATTEYSVSIVIGSDQLYWVVSNETARRLAKQGFHVLHESPFPCKTGERRPDRESW